MTHLKLVIAKLEHHRYGASSERGRKLLDQAELQLEELEADAAERATATDSLPIRRATSSGASCVASRCVARCRHTCLASVSSSPVRPHVPVVAGRYPSWARRSPRPWRACRASGR